MEPPSNSSSSGSDAPAAPTCRPFTDPKHAVHSSSSGASEDCTTVNGTTTGTNGTNCSGNSSSTVRRLDGTNGNGTENTTTTTTTTVIRDPYEGLLDCTTTTTTTTTTTVGNSTESNGTRRALMFELESRTPRERRSDRAFEAKRAEGRRLGGVNFFKVGTYDGTKLSTGFEGCECCESEFAYVNATHLSPLHARWACSENNAYLAVITNAHEQALVSRLVVGGQGSPGWQSPGHRQLSTSGTAGAAAGAGAVATSDGAASDAIKFESAKNRELFTRGFNEGFTGNIEENEDEWRTTPGGARKINDGKPDIEDWVWIGASRVDGQAWNFQWEDPDVKHVCGVQDHHKNKFRNFQNWRHGVALGGSNFASMSRKDGAWELEVADDRAMGYVCSRPILKQSFVDEMGAERGTFNPPSDDRSAVRGMGSEKCLAEMAKEQIQICEERVHRGIGMVDGIPGPGGALER